MTYAEEELVPLGFRVVLKKEGSFGARDSVIFAVGHLNLLFTCSCPAYPNIKALGCPLHHSQNDPGSSWPVEEAKKIPELLK